MSKQTDFKITMTDIFRKIEDSVDHLNSEIYKGNQVEVPEAKPQKQMKSQKILTRGWTQLLFIKTYKNLSTRKKNND